MAALGNFDQVIGDVDELYVVEFHPGRPRQNTPLHDRMELALAILYIRASISRIGHRTAGVGRRARIGAIRVGVYRLSSL
jgi:hypothetical protein